MNPAMKSKLVVITPPAAIVNNGSYTTASVDTKGYDYLKVTVLLGASDIAMSALKLQESNDDGSVDSYADITGAVFGTSTNMAGSTSALPSSSDDNKFFVFLVDLRGRERYIDLVATAGNGSTGTYLSAWAELYKAEALPSSTAELGCDEVLIVG